jgi:hypothetical protein
MKHFLLLFGLIACTQAGIAQDLNAGLLVHYNFNGNTNDVSGNGMHATVYGPILDLDINGIEGAYYFDGIDDYMELPGNSSLKPQLPVTFYCYLKVNSFATYNNFINTDDVDNVFTGMWMSSTVAGVVAVGYGDGGAIATTFSRRSAQTYNSLQLGQWHHVVGILRGPTDMEIWIDCEPQELLYTGTGGALQYSQNPGVLGKMDTGNSFYPPNYSHVTMDGLAFWNRDLTEEEIGLLCQGVLSNEATCEAEFTVNTDGNCIGTPITFTIDSENLGVDEISSVFWTFENGETSTALEPTTMFLAPGLITYSVQITTLLGCEYTVNGTHLIVIY